MTELVDLNNACERFEGLLKQLPFGAISYENAVPVEQQILKLKEIAEFITSKIKAIQISDTRDNLKSYENVNINNIQSEIVSCIIQEQIEDKAIHTAFQGIISKMILSNQSDDIKFSTYKKRIIEQLDLLKNTSQALKQLISKRQQVSIETAKIIQEITKEQSNYSSKLQKEKTKYNEECGEKLNGSYQEQITKIVERIQKINFMRVLINRLIIYGKLNWKDNPELKEILKSTRKPFTLESFPQQ